MSASKETPPLDTTGITVSLAGTSITNGKRDRRQRSFTGRAHNGNVSKKDKKSKKIADSIVYQKNGIPMAPPFLQKTHTMITTCDPDLAEWTPNGDMFVVKDQTRFANDVIPKYFDHKKFASFARQLNFYGFRKVQDKAVKHADIDKNKVHHVTYCNEHFKRDKPELLCKIQRSTKNAGNAPNGQEQQSQINTLKAEVASYQEQVQKLNTRLEFMERRFSYLERHLNLVSPNSGHSVKHGAGPAGQRMPMTVSNTSIEVGGIEHNDPDEISPTPFPTPITTVSSAGLKLSAPTLGFHPNTKTTGLLPPGSVPLPESKHVPFSTSNVSLLRALSSESVGMTSFEANYFALVMAEEGNERSGIEPNAATTNTSSQKLNLTTMEENYFAHVMADKGNERSGIEPNAATTDTSSQKLHLTTTGK